MLLSLLLQSAVAALFAMPGSSDSAQDTLETPHVEQYQLLSFEAEDALADWDFALAEAKWREAAEVCRDSVALAGINSRIAECVNGLNMQKFAYTPEVVARRRSSILDFQLYYPLPDRAWRSVPNQLDSTGGIPYSAAIYAPEDSPRIFYSAPDANGIRTIWETHFADSTWTVPSPAGCGPGAIYPMEYGQDLYFASDCLYGVGGYDLYVCRWNAVQHRWGPPENLGFPFCSPADDYLYARSGDGKHVVFASNRGCPIDSVNIYVVKLEEVPVRQAVSGKEELRRLCELAPAQARKANAGPQDPETREYGLKLRALRSVRDSLARHSKELEAMRARYSGASGAERDFLSSQIMELEMQTPKMQERLNEANRELAALEQDLFSKGIIINRASFEETPEETPDAKYEFVRKHNGKALKLKFF